MTFKRFLPVITALILALTLVLASFSVMAAGDPVITEDEQKNASSETNPVGGLDEITLQSESAQPATVSDEYNPGDVDGDGNIDINDVTALQSVFVGLASKTETFTRNGDTNVDGKINIWDATVIQLKIAGLYRELPVTVDGYYARIIQP